MLPMLLATASLAQAGEGLVGTGSGMVAGATLGHAVMWSLNDDRQSGMWVHYIPIAGPLVGMNEGGPMLTLADGFFLGMQVGGITGFWVPLHACVYQHVLAPTRHLAELTAAFLSRISRVRRRGTRIWRERRGLWVHVCATVG